LPTPDSRTSEAPPAETKPAHKRHNPRPQRLHTWFNLIPVAEQRRRGDGEVLFLDTFVTVERGGSDEAYTVRFEGQHEMVVVVHFGLVFVWYGEDLQRPDRPFPVLFEDPYPGEYVSSTPTIFEDTHVMDFVENGSDNLHFKAVHLWDYSKIYDHEITAETITLKQDTNFRYGKCSTKRSIRLLSNVLPRLTLTHDYVYHGPGLAVVGAQGKGTPDMHALVTLTPEGAYRTRVYVTMALSPDTFPPWAERAVGRISSRPLADRLAGVMANFIKNEFDIDAIIWRNRKHLPQPGLLPSEKALADVMRWGQTFYPKDFRTPEVPAPAPPSDRWEDLDALSNIAGGEVHRYSVGDDELIATVGEGGRLRVFDAFCPHQGAHLGHGGRLERDCLRCPFHGFYFDADGRCLGPNADNRGSFIDALQLTPIEHRVSEGRVQVRR